MGKNKLMSIDELLSEIQRLEASPYVQLAQKAEEMFAQLADYMVQLKKLEFKGRQLERQGITEDFLDSIQEGRE